MMTERSALIAAALPETALGLYDLLLRELSHPGWASLPADEQAWRLTLAVSDHFYHQAGAGHSSQQIRAILFRHQRNQAILRDFKGHNHAEVARRYKVSIRTVRRVVDRSLAG